MSFKNKSAMTEQCRFVLFIVPNSILLQIGEKMGIL